MLGNKVNSRYQKQVIQTERCLVTAEHDLTLVHRNGVHAELMAIDPQAATFNRRRNVRKVVHNIPRLEMD